MLVRFLGNIFRMERVRVQHQARIGLFLFNRLVYISKHGQDIWYYTKK